MEDSKSLTRPVRVAAEAVKPVSRRHHRVPGPRRRQVPRRRPRQVRPRPHPRRGQLPPRGRRWAGGVCKQVPHDGPAVAVKVAPAPKEPQPAVPARGTRGGGNTERRGVGGWGVGG